VVGRDEFRRVLRQWNDVLSRWDAKLRQELTTEELSALHAGLPDCFESFTRIYCELLPALERTPPEDNATAHDLLHDIGSVSGDLAHIRSHIAAAERGFEVLLRILGERAGPYGVGSSGNR